MQSGTTNWAILFPVQSLSLRTIWQHRPFWLLYHASPSKAGYRKIQETGRRTLLGRAAKEEGPAGSSSAHLQRWAQENAVLRRGQSVGTGRSGAYHPGSRQQYRRSPIKREGRICCQFTPKNCRRSKYHVKTAAQEIILFWINGHWFPACVYFILTNFPLIFEIFNIISIKNSCLCRTLQFYCPLQQFFIEIRCMKSDSYNHQIKT